MTAPGGFLDFFILEASDYIDQLDAQLLAADGTVDAEALQRAGRALRGSATMAKRAPIADMAAGVERVGRALREGHLQWNAALRGVLVAAIDDLKVLLRNLRAWSPADDARARARIDELIRYAPTRLPTPHTTPTTAAHDGYLATESANIGAGLELLATRPSDRDAAANVLRRVRALRGIASIKDHPALADVLEAAEQAAHPLERGEPTLSAERVALLGASATVLRSVAVAMRGGTTIDRASPELARFATALEAMHERETGADRVVPIAALFYGDGGATVVEAAANPPTSPAERFRLEVVSQGEHLRRVVDDARGARDDLARERVRRALRQAMRSLRQAAESFGEQDVADFVASHADSVAGLDARALQSLDDIATLLAQPASGGGSLAERLRALQDSRNVGSAPVPPAPLPPAPLPPAPAAAPPAAAPMPAASGDARFTTPSRTLTPVIASSSIAMPSAFPQERDRPAAAAVAQVAGTVVAAAAPVAGALIDLLDSGIRNLGTLRTTP
ncbi:MAG: Hpt domain protein, partial [Gemmatimonadetes bacterium]|nr:Hpt domain protein [Gemmatimonadota bacterium]